MHFTKKVTMIGSIIMLACCFTGCEKEVITVAGIQNPEVREDQYIVVENFELKQIEDNGKDAIACCAILIPAGYVESSTVPGMYVHSLSPLDSSNIYYTVLEGTGDGAVPDNLTSDSFEKELEDGLLIEVPLLDYHIPPLQSYIIMESNAKYNPLDYF